MSFLKATTIGFCIALLGVTFSPNAGAAAWNRKTAITFSGPVEIPGVHLKGFGVLPAGTYIFKMLDSQSDRHIVQIFSEDEKTVYATILAIPNYRLKATDKTVITFRERPAESAIETDDQFLLVANSLSEATEARDILQTAQPAVSPQRHQGWYPAQVYGRQRKA